MPIATPDMNIWRTRDWSSATEKELENKALAEAFGWESVRTLMAGSLSISPASVRPNAPTCSPQTYYVAPVGMPGILDPYVGIDGQWYNRGLGYAPVGCSCSDARRIALPGPVGRVESVTIDGVELQASAYEVVGGEWLVRTDGQGWPRHQDMYALAGAEHTFVVRYFQGDAPDELDAYCAGILADEFYKLLSGNGKDCRLPRTVTNVQRQGVTYDLGQTGFAEGKSGIPEVDVIVARRNPYLLRTPTIVMSIDTIPGAQRTTFTPGAAPTAPPVTGMGTLVPDPANPGLYIVKEN